MNIYILKLSIFIENALFTGKIINDGPNIDDGCRLSGMYFLEYQGKDYYYLIFDDLRSSIDGVICIRQNEDLPS